MHNSSYTRFLFELYSNPKLDFNPRSDLASKIGFWSLIRTSSQMGYAVASQIWIPNPIVIQNRILNPNQILIPDRIYIPEQILVWCQTSILAERLLPNGRMQQVVGSYPLEDSIKSTSPRTIRDR